MAGLYADKFNRNQLRVIQTTGAATAKALNQVDQLLLVLPRRVPAAVWRRLPQGKRIQSLLRRRVDKRVPAVSGRLNNDRQSAVHIGRIDPDTSSFERLTFARRMVAAVSGEKPGAVGILVPGFDDAFRELVAKDLLAAALAAGFPLPTFKAEAPPAAVKSLRLLGFDERLDLDRVLAEADGNNLARWLTSLPPNKLDANAYVDVLKDLSKEHGWQFKRFGSKELRDKGAGAFLAVAQGNPDDSACIVRLRYRPDGNSAAPRLALVGKGIIFDTGGNNLKPFNAMLDMHIDMGGSAVAVGALLSITELGLDVTTDCWLAITENRIGPTAYKSQDVVTAANGKTIQTIHTDAEGRMALADTLHFACEDQPAAIIDYATLTGACINAITSRYCGVFTNNPDLHPLLKKAGVDSGERVWPFPVGKEFVEELKSDTADIKQCSPSGGGDHILAASFLNEFVSPDVNWVHIDLSAAQRKGGLAHVPTDITGFGIRYSMDLLLDKQLLDRPAAE